jgi:hypothetical protein
MPGLPRPAAPAPFWAVADEAVLRRPTGGAAVMRAQLAAWPGAAAAGR